MPIKKIQCPVMNYAWGERNTDGKEPYISRLTGLASNGNPMAELWIGAHPKAPAQIFESGQSLLAYFAEHKEAVNGTGLPFLLKVLTCTEPLSIQSHPDPALAIKLHRELPLEFPDDKPKPEVMYALSEFKAMAGFRPLEDTLYDLHQVPGFAKWLDGGADYPQLCKYILNASQEQIADMISSASTIQEGKHFELFRKLNSKYPGDPGAFFAFLLNYVTLKPGQAIFIPANTPHAYLHGCGIECMANSDNVIRAGLTPKTVNKKVLLETLDFKRTGKFETFLANGKSTVPGVEFDYECAPFFRLMIVNGTCSLPRKASVLLALEGEAELLCNGERMLATRGSTWFIPQNAGDVSVYGEKFRLAVAL